MKKLNRKEIQGNILMILCDFADFCEKNKLRYSLCGGTLLGAVRHKGFIPWDDDIDISMPRPDYDKFIELTSKQSIADRLEVVSFENGTFKLPFAKLLDKNTIVKSEYNEEYGSENLWIDILPVDGLPEDDILVKNHYSKLNFNRRLLSMSIAKMGTGKTRIKKFIKLLTVPILKIVGSNYFAKKIDTIAKKCKYEDSQYVGVVSWGLYHESEKLKKEEYENLIELEFCGKMFKSLPSWDKYLSNLYGNYMELPKEENRKIHDIDAWLVD